MDLTQTTSGQFLRLTISQNETHDDAADVWVESLCGKFCSSYACATNEHELAYQDGGCREDKRLSRKQLEWLDSDTVQNFLARVNY